MKEYKVTSTDSKHFTLIANNIQIGKLVYEKWFSHKADIILTDNTIYKVEPKGFWGTTIEIKKAETVLLDVKTHWDGSIVIETFFNGIESDFTFKTKKFLKSSFVLEDKDKQELFIVQTDFNWSKINFDYVISTNESFEKFDNFDYKAILLLITTHCANHFMTTMMAV